METLRRFERLSKRILNRSKSSDVKDETPDFNFETEFKEEKCSIIWRVENVHKCTLKCGEFFQSPPFSTTFSEDNWTLRFYPRGIKTENIRRKKTNGAPEDLYLYLHNARETVGLYINRTSTHPEALSFKCRFSYKRYLLKDNYSKQKGCGFVSEEGAVEIKMDSTKLECGTDNLFDSQNLIHPQTLVIRCDIYLTNAHDKRFHGNYMPGLWKSCALYQDLKQMYENGKFSDVTLQVGDAQFPAHKAILASRSAVFDAMFRHDMKESQTGVVQVEDIEPAILSNMLQYIYTGTVDDFNIEKAIPLYSAANKYLLEELTEWCVDVILANMAVENVCKIAVLIETHPDPKLKKAACNMFRNYTGDIFKRKEWQDLVQDSDRRALVSSILQSVSADFTTNFP